MVLHGRGIVMDRLWVLQHELECVREERDKLKAIAQAVVDDIEPIGPDDLLHDLKEALEGLEDEGRV
jgi:hypothetical protein